MRDVAIGATSIGTLAAVRTRNLLMTGIGAAAGATGGAVGWFGSNINRYHDGFCSSDAKTLPEVTIDHPNQK